jgi:hypothetical protein
LRSPIRQLSGGIVVKNPPQVVASEPEIVVKAKETPTQRHRIDQQAKQLKTRTIGRLVTCRIRQSQFGAWPCAHIPERWHANPVIARQEFGISRQNLGEMLFKDACKYFELSAGAARP